MKALRKPSRNERRGYRYRAAQNAINQLLGCRYNPAAQ
jgi:hypothetical protein